MWIKTYEYEITLGYTYTVSKLFGVFGYKIQLNAEYPKTFWNWWSANEYINNIFSLAEKES